MQSLYSWLGSRRLLLVFLLFAASASRAETARILGWNFDWDDNLVFMPTTIVLFDKATGREKAVSTGEYAKIRELVGKPGEYEKYEIRLEPRTGSFRYFRDQPDRDYFLEDVKKMLAKKPEEWQGPSWRAFVHACSRKESARWTTVITARGHSGETMLGALKLLQKLGYIRYLPLASHLYGVANSKHVGTSASPSAAKIEVMKEMLNRIDRRGPPTEGPLVLDQAGRKRKRLHLWGFSDDDYGNVRAAIRGLGAEAAKGKWRNVKITLFYTGKHHPGIEPHTMVLTPDGTTRKVTPEELARIPKFLRVCAKALAG